MITGSSVNVPGRRVYLGSSIVHKQCNRVPYSNTFTATCTKHFTSVGLGRVCPTVCGDNICHGLALRLHSGSLRTRVGDMTQPSTDVAFVNPRTLLLVSLLEPGSVWVTSAVVVVALLSSATVLGSSPPRWPLLLRGRCCRLAPLLLAPPTLLARLPLLLAPHLVRAAAGLSALRVAWVTLCSPGGLASAERPCSKGSWRVLLPRSVFPRSASLHPRLLS